MAKLGADLEELETGIIPRYQNMVADLKTKMEKAEKFYGKLTTDVDGQGEILHRGVDIAISSTKLKILMMKNKHLSTLKRNSDEIRQKITDIKHIDVDLESTISSNDVAFASGYKSRNEEFKALSPKLRVTLPRFNPGKINKDHLNEMIGTLTPLSINTEASKTTVSAEAVSSTPARGIKRGTEATSYSPTRGIKQGTDATSSTATRGIKQGTVATSSALARGIKRELSPPTKRIKRKPARFLQLDY
jgi:hypothetical protein